jgi:hypothetical protein
VLRRISGPKKDEIIGGWREMHNEELHNFYFSPNLMRLIKSRRMISARREEECIQGRGMKSA